jgi:glycerate 2-kinase
VIRFDPEPRELRGTRATVLDAAKAAIEAIDPEGAVARSLRRAGGALRVDERFLELDCFRRAHVFAFGKAAAPMARASLAALDGLEVDGVLVAPREESVAPLRCLTGAHPVPDERSCIAGRALLEAAARVEPDDLVLVLVSGGASAMVESPAADLTLADIQETTALLLRAGATISQLNAVRKHLSSFKGGRFAEALQRAGCIVTRIVSDVIGSPLDVIASGPMVPDASTFAEALDALGRLPVPRTVREHLERGSRGGIPETPKKGEVFDRQLLRVVADGALAAEGARAALARKGVSAQLVSTCVEGEAREVGARLVEDARALPPRHALIYAGETTVTVRGDGRGGRNQELALAAAQAMQEDDGLVLLSLGTDGIDGMSDAAGALVDGKTLRRGRALGLSEEDALARNDSGSYLAAVGDALFCGPTGTNVGDVAVVMRAAQATG